MSGAWMLTALLLGLISAIGAIWLATAVQMLFEAPIPGATLGPFLVIPFNRLSAGTRLLSRLYQVKPPFKVTLPTAVRSKLLRALGPGFDDPANPQTLLRGHEFAMWLLIITGVFYLVPAYLFYYRVLLPAQPLTYYVPGLYWILIAALLACWSMSFATFVLDLYRIPLIAGITLYVGLVAVFVHSDHFFATHRLRADAKTTSQIG
jgi:hypothetical protein